MTTTTTTTCSDCGHDIAQPAFTIRRGKRVYTYCKACVEKRLKAKKGAFMSVGDA